MKPSDLTGRATTRTRRETPVKIIRQGAIVVGSAWVEAEGADVVAIGLDCSTKYYDVSTSTHYTGAGYDGWTIHLSSCAETLRMAEGIDRDLPTDVILPEFRAGWRPWTYDGGARYQVSICLVRCDPEQLLGDA
jgi:hypothetical protein